MQNFTFAMFILFLIVTIVLGIILIAQAAMKRKIKGLVISTSICGGLALLMLVVGLSTMSTNEESAPSDTTATVSSNQASKTKDNGNTTITDSQKKLNDQLKKDAVQANFVQLNGHEDDFNNKKVYAVGKISVVDYNNVMDDLPSFSLAQQEGNGYGNYHITNVLEIKGLKDGDTVKVYGTVQGTDKTGAPKIVATVIEKQ